jgi:hypothetical protein
MLLNGAQGEGEVSFKARSAPGSKPRISSQENAGALVQSRHTTQNTHHVPFPLSPSTALLCHIRHLRAHPDRARLHRRAPGPDKGT